MKQKKLLQVWLQQILKFSMISKQTSTPASGIRPIVLVHGGAGDISDASIPAKKAGVKMAARRGYETLQQSGSVLDAVQEAVSYLENDVNFNAGHGSVLNMDGQVRMDAAIISGADLKAGCVTLVRDIRHPIELARTVLETTPHHFMAGEGAMRVATDAGIVILPEDALVTPAAVEALEQHKQCLELDDDNKTKLQPERHDSPGTVGAVAIDERGNVAAATSTGGLTGKWVGRIGDSPILGAGTYADNLAGAVSATGHGETLMRYNVASRILALITYKGLSAQQATEMVLNQMTERFGETAGIISIDRNGTLGIHFTTNRMTWAYQRDDELHFGIEHDEDEVEIVDEPPI